MAARKGAARTVVKKAPARRAPRRSAGRDPVMTTDVRAAAVDKIPPSYDARSMRYAKVLREIRQAKITKPVVVATFKHRQGATEARKALESGARPVDGDVDDWEFEARRTDTGSSVLYARLL